MPLRNCEVPTCQLQSGSIDVWCQLRQLFQRLLYHETRRYKSGLRAVEPGGASVVGLRAVESGAAGVV